MTDPAPLVDPDEELVAGSDGIYTGNELSIAAALDDAVEKGDPFPWPTDPAESAITVGAIRKALTRLAGFRRLELKRRAELEREDLEAVRGRVYAQLVARLGELEAAEFPTLSAYGSDVLDLARAWRTLGGDVQPPPAPPPPVDVERLLGRVWATIGNRRGLENATAIADAVVADLRAKLGGQA